MVGIAAHTVPEAVDRASQAHKGEGGSSRDLGEMTT